MMIRKRTLIRHLLEMILELESRHEPVLGWGIGGRENIRGRERGSLV